MTKHALTVAELHQYLGNLLERDSSGYYGRARVVVASDPAHLENAERRWLARSESVQYQSQTHTVVLVARRPPIALVMDDD